MKKEKKIKLIIFPGFFLPHVGGLETHVNEFVKILSRNKNYDVTVCSPNLPNTKFFEIMHDNVKVIRYPAFELIFNWPCPKFWSPKFWKVVFRLYSKKYDVVMSRTNFYLSATFSFFFAKFRFKSMRSKYIHVEHASDFPQLDSPFKKFLAKFYMKSLGLFSVYGSDKLIAISKGTKDFLQRNYSLKNKLIPVIRRGFNFDLVNSIPADKSIKKSYGDKKIISFAGRLIDGKGVQDVIKALKNVDQDFVFLIIGKGQYKKSLEVLVKKYNLEEKVFFLGEQPYEKVIGILKSSHIFVHPSYSEGLPTAVLDGVFSGINVVASDVGGTYEILGDLWNSKNYKLVKAKDIKSINNSILDLLSIKDKPDKKVIREVVSKFDWDIHTKLYEKEIERLLK